MMFYFKHNYGMGLKRRIIVILSFAASLFVYSQQYTSESLREIGKKIELKYDKNMSPGYHNVGRYKGKMVVIGVNSKKELFHIGYALFADNMKTEYPSEVYNFLERYLLELDCINEREELVSQHLSDDKVMVKAGSLSNVKKITKTTPFSLTNIDDKYYEIEWNNKDEVLIRLQFPIDYQLLLGVRKSEIELTLQNLLQSTAYKWAWVENLLLKSPDVVMMADGYFRSKESLVYYIDELNTIEYYERGKKKTYVPIYDEAVAEYSLHNLFRGIIPENHRYRLSISQNLYGYKKTSFAVPLSQWLSYCKSNEMQIYVGTSSLGEDSYKVTVVAQNKKLGYNHLMKVIVPKDFICANNTTFATELYAFIPTSNLKDVYQKNK